MINRLTAGLLTLTGTILLAATSHARTSVLQAAADGPPISIEAALALVERAREQSAARGLRTAIAVVEPSGELVAFARMDEAAYASIRIAQHKARTAARFRMPTAMFEERVRAGDINLLSSDEVIAVGGGVPIVVNRRVIGALGVSGASAAEDAALASAIADSR